MAIVAVRGNKGGLSVKCSLLTVENIGNRQDRRGLSAALQWRLVSIALAFVQIREDPESSSL
ncbi:MAG: hypothetical protein KKC77_11585 [Proteobacteria bacterium]|nr:hypothetical protein [Pseudomonadota bacterium]